MVQVRKVATVAPVVLAASLVLTSCSDDSAGPETGVDVADVAEAEVDGEVVDEEADEIETGDEEVDGDDLIGQRVTVSGEATEIVDPSAFVIGGEALGGEGALVLSATGSWDMLPTPITEETVGSDTILQVSGVVRELEIEDLEEELGVEYDEEALEEYEGEVVILADQVNTLAGESITLAGAVSGLLSTVSFQLAGAGWTVVVLDAEQAAVEPGDYVQVTGTVRQLDVEELESEFGTDLDDDAYEPYVGDLVLVAESVTPVAPAEVAPAP